MTVAYFLDITATPENVDPLRELYRNLVAPDLLKRDEVESVHLFVSDKAERLFDSDQKPPELSLQVDVRSIESLQEIFAGSDLATLFPLLDGCKATQDCFEPIHFPVTGEAEPLPRRALLSYNVRYYQPVGDVKSFVEFYLTHHPQILTDLPLIRNILCYLPIQLDDQIGFPGTSCIIGNEVVFDTFQDFRAAQLSDVRVRLREDMQVSPVPAGPNTHFAFRREDFFK